MIRNGIACCALIAMLGGCAGGGAATITPPAPNASAASRIPSLIPAQFRPPWPLPFHVHAPRTAKTMGIYVSTYFNSSIFGYPPSNRGNGPPICSKRGLSYINGFTVDGLGHLVVPDNGVRRIYVSAATMCGPPLGEITDAVGQPSDAAIGSGSALIANIVIGHIIDNEAPGGSISLCSLSYGCQGGLINPAMVTLAGVATRHGDCWGSAADGSNAAVLVYFKHCAGGGRVASGFKNAYYGGLDFDRAGNLVSISAVDAKLYVYKGCRPACKLIGGPFALSGFSVFGHLNANSTKFVAGDVQYGQADIYKYTPRKVTYEYSFDNGIDASDDVEGAAFSPQ
jgi:hypothetical protein